MPDAHGRLREWIARNKKRHEALEALEADVATILERKRQLIRSSSDVETIRLTVAELRLMLDALDRCSEASHA